MLPILQFINNTMKSQGLRLLEATEDTLVDKDKVATGETLRSLRIEVQQGGDQVNILLFGSDTIEKIEKGREPFKELLPFNDPTLLSWMKARSIPINAQQFIIASIYENPLEGVDIIQNSLRKVKKQLEESVIKAGLKGVQVQIVKELQELF